ncbi:MAG TPA: hypothetical protein VK512_12625 [Xanthobacteraceae bacterium]|nr:hypothetical protein [Xanthobacteraceae bacterium]
MPEYRFYTIGKDGHVATPAITYEAPKDADALKEAKRLLDGHDIEIWQGARVVAYLVPDET